MNREQLAWAAGIMDGEGTFRCNKQNHTLRTGKKRTYYRPSLQVTQTAKYGGIPDMLTRLVEVLGGKIYGPYVKPKSNHSDYYDWKLGKLETVQAAMCMVWPWIGSQKRRDAIQMMKEYLENRPPMEWRRGPTPGSRREWPKDEKGRFIKHT